MNDQNAHLVLEAIFQSGKSCGIILKGCKGLGKADFAKKVTLKFLEKNNGFKINNIFSYPNFFYLSKNDTNSITIDQLRKLNNFLSKKPLINGARIVLVDCIEDLTIQASNCLLKNLEEPSKDVYFLLINHNKKILPTIKSRCKIINFSKLDDQQMEDLILKLNLDNKDFLKELSMGQIGFYQQAIGFSDDFYNKFKVCLINAIKGKNFKQSLLNIISQNLNADFFAQIILRTLYVLISKKSNILKELEIKLNDLIEIYSSIETFLNLSKDANLDEKHKIFCMFLILKNYNYKYIYM
jgi:DNA polymerase III, delta subunit